MRPNFLIAAVGCAVLLLPAVVRADDKALIAAGVPALSREWSGNEYAQTAGLLSEGKVPLPLAADEQGRAFLRRLTAVENLSFCRDGKLPMGSRLNDFAKMMSGVSTILVQYSTQANKGMDVHAECAQMMVFALRTAAAGVQLVNEFMPTIPKDEKYAARMEGLKKFRSGLTTMFAGAETSLSEKTFYKAPDFSLLLDAMVETLPTLKQVFSDDYKLELRHKLEVDQPTFPQARDAQDFQKMIGELGS